MIDSGELEVLFRVVSLRSTDRLSLTNESPLRDRSCAGDEISIPSQRTTPDVRRRYPPSAFSVVVFPAPLGQPTQRSRPRARWRFISPTRGRSSRTRPTAGTASSTGSLSRSSLAPSVTRDRAPSSDLPHWSHLPGASDASVSPRYAAITAGSARTAAGRREPDHLSEVENDDPIADLHHEVHVVLHEQNPHLRSLASFRSNEANRAVVPSSSPAAGLSRRSVFGHSDRARDTEQPPGPVWQVSGNCSRCGLSVERVDDLGAPSR